MTVLSSIWERIQRSLFPFLEEELGLMTEKQQKLVSIVEIIKKHGSEHLVGHISRDSTEIIAREKPVARKKTKKKQSNRKRGRPKKGETVSPNRQSLWL